MSGDQKTDVLLNVENCPFVTLTESKIPNTWYHNDTDVLFRLTQNGFKIIKGSKKSLIKNNLL